MFQSVLLAVLLATAAAAGAPITSGGSSTSSRPAALPRDLPVGVAVETLMPGDRSLRVAHATAEHRAAIVYLHGMCGNPKGADPWLDAATRHATVITVRASVKCPDRPGYKWPRDVSLIQSRIEAALRHVQAEREGLLDIDRVTLVGYSQGAHRGERLAAAFPQRYPLLALGGPPTAPSPLLLRHASRVAVLGGEREDTSHMLAGFLDVHAAGIPARFFVLPAAHHGSYGPDGPRVVSSMLDWLFANGTPVSTNSMQH